MRIKNKMAASLAAAVLLLVLAIYVFKLLIPKICSQICKTMQGQTPREVSLQADLKVLRAEQEEVDMKEEFAKHAKLQRKINKITDEIASIRSSKLKVLLTVQSIVTLLLHLLHKLSYVMIIWQLKAYPVVYLREEWTWPLERLLAFPSGQKGTIGVTWWVIACSLTIRKLHHFLTNLMSPTS